MQAEKIKKELNHIINRLPDEKVVELLHFAQMLTKKESNKNSSVDGYSLHLQQKALSRIWDAPEEDIYEL